VSSNVAVDAAVDAAVDTAVDAAVDAAASLAFQEYVESAVQVVQGATVLKAECCALQIAAVAAGLRQQWDDAASRIDAPVVAVAASCSLSLQCVLVLVHSTASSPWSPLISTLQSRHTQ
jgi:hypothetical protein